MVGTLMLLKALHCKRMCRKDHKNILSQNSLNLDYKVPKTENDELKTCRVCLKEGNIPIYGNSIYDDVSEDLNTFGGINTQNNDRYPKYLCDSCSTLLENAILLRKTAQQSDQLLRTKIKTLTSENDIPVLQSNEDQAIESPVQSNKDYESDDNEIHMEERYDKDIKESSRLYNCKRCDVEFNTFEELSEHRLTIEHENMRLTCPICNNSYTALYIKKHMALHQIESPYMCDICGKQFIVHGQFTRHRLIHFNNLPFKCSLCPYRGRFTESLKMHMRSHTGEKPYQCSQCAARFVNKSNLNKHILTHTGQHSYKCEACGRGFYTKRDLDLHFKVDHTGIKDHLCNICGKAFGYRKQMMKHQLKVHKRQKLRSGRTPLYLQVDKQRQLHGIMSGD